MIQPNFLEIDWRVRRAIELTEARPEALSSRTYQPKLNASLQHFRTMTDDTDQTYNQWRVIRGEQMKAFRDLRIESDRTRALCDEHALDEYPSKRIVYTDEKELLEFVEDAVVYLKANQAEWDWIAGAISRLEGGMSQAAALKTKEKAAYRTYCQRAKERVAAYDHLFGLFRDYIRDARNDVASEELYQEIRLKRG